MIVLAAESLSKSFGPVQALDRVSCSFQGGEIHAVLGENGAGKSTLMNLLGGMTRPDAGRIVVDGHPAQFRAPFEARAAGIEMVHQHFMLVPRFTVAENLLLGRLAGTANRAAAQCQVDHALEFAAQVGWQIPLDTQTGSLSVGLQQRIEILKALAGDARCIILDEPTAVLSPDEVEELFRLLRRLREEGRSIILIAHKLSEVLAVADRTTVLRHGKWVASAPRDDVDAAQLAQWMVGTAPESVTPLPPATGPVALAVRDLHIRGDRGEAAVRGLSFEVRQNEIFGIGGVDGNGQVQLAEAIVGLRPIDRGTINLPSHQRPGYIPQDRQSEGLALSMSIADNLLAGHWGGWILAAGPARERAERLVERYRIKIGSLGDPVSSLSGGNQQKVVVARTLETRPEVIVALNPTRGLDLRATHSVHEALLDCARQGAAVVLISTDLDELAAIASRTAIMSEGRFADDELAQSMLGGRI